jgi:hypothetical protein
MKALLLAVVVTTLASSPAVNAADTASAKANAGRWQIHAVVNGMSVREGKPGSRAENTILLDSETGKTWLLWPTKDTATGYSWIELPQREDAAKP